jgi:hypothetical protein
MSVKELIQEVRLLNQQDKLRVLRELVDSFAPEETTEADAKLWSPQVNDPDEMAFLVHLEKVLQTEGLEAANKLITNEDKSAHVG